MGRVMRRVLFIALTFAIVAGLAVVGARQMAHGAHSSWPSANGDLSSTRASGTAFDASAVRVLWRFRLPRRANAFGAITLNPVIDRGTVYVQDSSSTVFALDAKTGVPRWTHRLAAPNDGPNGVALSGSRLYTATDTTALALDAATGKTLWSRRLVNRFEQFVGIAPIEDRGRVYYSTQGFPHGGRGAVYALDARTGTVVWRFGTIVQPWPRPDAGGGGAWYPVSIDERGDVYVGNSNPGPWGGSKRYPNGGVFA